MSLFNAFGQNGFAALAQTLENIGNIVAPIAPEDDQQHPQNPDESETADDSETEDGESFNDRVQGFFNRFRENAEVDNFDTPEHEPSSPGTFVSVALSDENSRIAEAKPPRSERGSKLAATISSAFGMVSGVELEKKVQQKYREQLEDGIEQSDKKYIELQQASATRIALLEKEVKEWKALAEVSNTGFQGGSEQDREDEMNVLYEKLGALTTDVEQREDELRAARGTIAELQAQVSSSRQHSDHELAVQELEVLLEAQKRENDELAEQLEEARDLQTQAEDRERRLRTEKNSNEEQLTALTNKLRDSNRAIAALEQQLLDAQQLQQAQALGSDAQRDTTESVALEATKAEIAELHERVAQLTERVAERDEALQVAGGKYTAVEAEVRNLSAQLRRVVADNTGLQESLREATDQVRTLEEELSSLQQANTKQKLQLEDAHHRESASHKAQTVLEGQLKDVMAAQALSARDMSEQAEQTKFRGAALQDAPTPSPNQETFELVAQLEEALRAHALLEAKLHSAETRHAQETLALKEQLGQAQLREAAAQELARIDVEQQLQLLTSQHAEELAVFRSRLEQMHLREEDAQAALVQLRAELGKEVQLCAAEARSLSDELAAKTEECAKLREELQVAGDAYARLATREQELTASYSIAQERMEALAAELRAARAQTQELQLRVQIPVEADTAKHGGVPAPLPSPAASVDASAEAKGGSDTEALAALQLEHNKAIKKIKMLTKQLKEKDVELARLNSEVAQRSTQHPSGGTPAAAGVPATPAVDAVDELRAQLSRREAEYESLMASHAEELSRLRDEFVRAAESHKVELDAVHSQLRNVESELTAWKAAVQRVEDDAASSKAKILELLEVLQQEQSAHEMAAAARDALLEQMSQVAAEARNGLRSESVDSCISDAGADTSVGSTVSTVEDAALTGARADCAKAIKRIRQANARLKDKDAELAEVRARCETGEAEVARLRGALHEVQAALQASTEKAGKHDAERALHDELDAVRASLATAETEKERLVGVTANLQEQVANLQGDLQETRQRHEADYAQLEALRRTVEEGTAELQAAQARAASLEGALTESEAALKATEETAWQCKAEAAELLFAYEQEQGKAVVASTARDELAAQLSKCQAELSELQGAAASEHTAVDSAAVMERLNTLHAYISEAVDALEPLVSAVDGPTSSSKADASFALLVQGAPHDTVGALSHLADTAKVVASLAQEVGVAVRDGARTRSKLEEEQATVVQLLQTIREHATALSSASSGATDANPVSCASCLTIAAADSPNACVPCFRTGIIGLRYSERYSSASISLPCCF
jgi:chromosome segregation ATPase